MSLLLSVFEADDVGRGSRRNVPRCGEPRPDRELSTLTALADWLA